MRSMGNFFSVECMQNYAYSLKCMVILPMYCYLYFRYCSLHWSILPVSRLCYSLLFPNSTDPVNILFFSHLSRTFIYHSSIDFSVIFKIYVLMGLSGFYLGVVDICLYGPFWSSTKLAHWHAWNPAPGSDVESVEGRWDRIPLLGYQLLWEGYDPKCWGILWGMQNVFEYLPTVYCLILYGYTCPLLQDLQYILIVLWFSLCYPCSLGL
jgi:hypothetical protein